MTDPLATVEAMKQEVEHHLTAKHVAGHPVPLVLRLILRVWLPQVLVRIDQQVQKDAILWGRAQAALIEAVQELRSVKRNLSRAMQYDGRVERGSVKAVSR